MSPVQPLSALVVIYFYLQNLWDLHFSSVLGGAMVYAGS